MFIKTHIKNSFSHKPVPTQTYLPSCFSLVNLWYNNHHERQRIITRKDRGTEKLSSGVTV